MPNLKMEDLIDAVAVLIGEHDSIRKRAAYILLKYFAPKDVFDYVMCEVEKIAPVTERNDPRVTKWKNEVVSRGICENCGSTEHLEAHHIAYWSEAPTERINAKNGACLCHRCHTEEHCGEKAYHMMKARKF